MVEVLENGKVVLGKDDITLGRPQKARKRVWARVLTEPVDTTKTNGFAFSGTWLKVRGDPAFIDDIVTPPCFIVATTADGSAKHPRTGISLFKVEKDGTITELFHGGFDDKAESAASIKAIAEIVNPFFEQKKKEETKAKEEKPGMDGWLMVAIGVGLYDKAGVAEAMLRFMTKVEAAGKKWDFLEDVKDGKVYFDMGTIQVHETARVADEFIEALGEMGVIPAIPENPNRGEENAKD